MLSHVTCTRTAEQVNMFANLLCNDFFDPVSLAFELMLGLGFVMALVRPRAPAARRCHRPPAPARSPLARTRGGVLRSWQDFWCARGIIERFLV